MLRRRRNAALGAGDWKAAAQLQEKIHTLLGDNADAAGVERENGVRLGLAYQEAVSLLEARRVDEARELLRRLLDEEPRFVPAAIMLGEAAALAGDDARALAEWRGGYESTGSPVFLQRIEDHFIESERPLEAIETLHELIADADNDLLPRFFLGRLYYRLEMHAEALKALDGLGERIHSSPTYHLLLARIHERRGDLGAGGRVVPGHASRRRASPPPSTSAGSAAPSSRPGRTAASLCGSWNSVEFDFEEEKISAEELGRPVAAGVGGLHRERHGRRGPGLAAGPSSREPRDRPRSRRLGPAPAAVPGGRRPGAGGAGGGSAGRAAGRPGRL